MIKNTENHKFLVTISPEQFTKLQEMLKKLGITEIEAEDLRYLYDNALTALMHMFNGIERGLVPALYEDASGTVMPFDLEIFGHIIQPLQKPKPALRLVVSKPE